MREMILRKAPPSKTMLQVRTLKNHQRTLPGLPHQARQPRGRGASIAGEGGSGSPGPEKAIKKLPTFWGKSPRLSPCAQLTERFKGSVKRPSGPLPVLRAVFRKTIKGGWRTGKSGTRLESKKSLYEIWVYLLTWSVGWQKRVCGFGSVRRQLKRGDLPVAHDSGGDYCVGTQYYERRKTTCQVFAGRIGFGKGKKTNQEQKYSRAYHSPSPGGNPPLASVLG